MFIFLPALPSPEHWLVLAASPGLRWNVATPGVTDVLLTKVPGLPQSMEVDQRLDKKFRQDVSLLGPLLQLEGVRTSSRLQRLFTPRGGASLFLSWGEGRGVSRGLARGVPSVFGPPLRWCSVQRACTVPCFCPWPFRRGWSWSSNTLATQCKEPTHWKRPWW